MRRILLALLLLLLSLSGIVLAQAVDGRLNRRQRQHLDLFAKTQYAIREGKTPSDKIFKAFYTFVAASNKEAIAVNRDRAQKLIDRANRALAAGKNDQASRLEEGAKLYANMVKLNEAIVEAFEKNNSVHLSRLMSQYLTLEADMTKIGLELPPRDWFTPQEAEKWMVAMAQARKK
jgi:hypothetical protein